MKTIKLILEEHKYNVEIVSIAPRGSQQPDVVFKVDNNQYNAEIKGLASLNNDTAVFDISCSRKNNNFPVLNEMANQDMVIEEFPVPVVNIENDPEFKYVLGDCQVSYYIMKKDYNKFLELLPKAKEFFKDKPDTKINTVENNAWYLIK